ncbi:MAG: hypothetical protein K9L82_15340 [Chromatiaceae bacterium]|nr:hypothetical protein [Chromatiaceae bacterium]MCF7996330.1 hypothetical protein [Chromatiaceae bacterium]MCF8016847.1 hypothetical protein [Chromatiaceae bacterium]
MKEINRLFGDIRGWLLEAGVESDAIEQTQQTLYEEQLGQYPAPVFRVAIGLNHITFQPKGTFLIGAYGRIDATSDLADTTTVKLVADIDQSQPTAPDISALEQDWQWLVYPGGARSGGHVLDKETFADLMGLLLGETPTSWCRPSGAYKTS